MIGEVLAGILIGLGIYKAFTILRPRTVQIIADEALVKPDVFAGVVRVPAGCMVTVVDGLVFLELDGKRWVCDEHACTTF